MDTNFRAFLLALMLLTFAAVMLFAYAAPVMVNAGLGFQMGLLVALVSSGFFVNTK